MGEELEPIDQQIESSWGRHADIEFVVSMVSPSRGPAVGKWLETLRVRSENRGRAAFEAATDSAGVSADELLDTIMGDEQLTDLFRTTMEFASRSGSEQKLRALGRALASGALSKDDAELDKAQLMLRTVGQLEPIDVRVLLMLVKHPQPYWVALNPESTSSLLPDNSFPPLAIRTHLQQLGLARERPSSRSKTFNEGSGVRTTFVITPFGREVLILLSESGRAASVDDM